MFQHATYFYIIFNFKENLILSISWAGRGRIIQVYTFVYRTPEVEVLFSWSTIIDLENIDLNFDIYHEAIKSLK